MTNLEKSFIAMQAAQFCKAWGMWAAVRFTMKRTGWNYATALRCITVARVCEMELNINVRLRQSGGVCFNGNFA